MQPLCDGGVDQYPQVIDDLEDPWRGQGLSIVVMKGYRDIHMASFNLDLGTRDGTREQPNATCRFHQVLVFFFLLISILHVAFHKSFGYTRAMTQVSKRPSPPIVMHPGIVS